MPAFGTISIRRATTAALAGAMMLSLLPAAAMGSHSQPPREIKQAEWRVLALMNQYRESRGLEPLRMAMRVRLVARDRSRDMQAKNYFAHGSPTGESAGTLLHARRVRHYGWGENIGWISFLGWDRTNRGMIDAWKGSSGHNRMLLTGDYNYVGIGVARNSTSARYTIVFVKQEDHTAPVSGMVASPTGISVAAEDGRKAVTVRWWGRDRKLQQRTAGIRGFTVQKRTANGWRTLRRNTLTHSLTINLAEGSHKFRVRAVDRRGNVGSWRRPLAVTVH